MLEAEDAWPWEAVEAAPRPYELIADLLLRGHEGYIRLVPGAPYNTTRYICMWPLRDSPIILALRCAPMSIILRIASCSMLAPK